MVIIGTKWKPLIVYVLQTKKVRFGQLDAIIPLITRKILAEQLKELEIDGIFLDRKRAGIITHFKFDEGLGF